MMKLPNLIKFALGLLLLSTVAACATRAGLPKTSWVVSDYYCPFDCFPTTQEQMHAHMNEMVYLDNRGTIRGQFGGECRPGATSVKLREESIQEVVNIMNKAIPVEAQTDPDKPYFFTPANSGLNTDSKGNPRNRLITGGVYCTEPDGKRWLVHHLLSVEPDRLMVYLEDAAIAVLR
jgi:hypothetical protein